MTVKNLVSEFKKEREQGGYIIDIDLLNVAYYVLKNCSRGVKDSLDVVIVYDNLEINSQIINNDTLNDWDEYQLKRYTGHTKKYFEDNIKKGYFFVLDYYYIVNGKDFHRSNVCLKFKYGYNIF